MYLLRPMLVQKRLKLRLSGSASQKRFRDTPRFKFQAVWARIQPFLSRSVEKRGDQSRFKSLGLFTNIDWSRYTRLSVHHFAFPAAMLQETPPFSISLSCLSRACPDKSMTSSPESKPSQASPVPVGVGKKGVFFAFLLFCTPVHERNS